MALVITGCILSIVNLPKSTTNTNAEALALESQKETKFYIGIGCLSCGIVGVIVSATLLWCYSKAKQPTVAGGTPV